MPRLRNVQSGAVISCAEETASRLGAQWQPADEATAKKAPTKKAASSKSSGDDK